MSEKIIDEVMRLVGSYGSTVEATVIGNPENYTLQSNEDAAFEAIRAKLREVLERKPLTDAQIEQATGAKIGRPLFLAAKGFVLATERAHGIGS